jgi:1-hydroxycarotenoid 3,4-desaturase
MNDDNTIEKERIQPTIARADKIVVVGAGVAGLVSALLLAHAGASVTVIEARDECGGKIRQLKPGTNAQLSPTSDVGIDSGPTVLTMKWVFEEIFRAVGTELNEVLTLTQLDILAKHAWSQDEGAQQLTLYADALQSEQAVGEFAGAAELKRFKKFCADAQALYKALEGPIIKEANPSVKKLALSLGPRGLALLAGIGPMRSLWDSLGSYFKDPRLQQLFARYATYCGSSPWSAPATLMLIAQVEMDGVWSVKGGIKALANGLEKLCKNKGVEFLYNTRCERIELQSDSVSAVLTDTAVRIPTKSVVYNGDIEALLKGLHGADIQQKISSGTNPPNMRSLSAVTWSMKCKVQESRFVLDRHNVFFQNNYESEFIDIFNSKHLPISPTVYICAQDRGLAPKGDAPVRERNLESIFCLVNAPANGDTHQLSQKELQACQTSTQSLLNRCGLTLEFEQSNYIQTLPQHFNQLFPATGGALYGQATHGWMQVFTRAKATTSIKGLFLVGGSVHPGPGLPMAAMSGRLGAAAVMDHLGLTKR